ncbi:hypothetical protein [Pantanalinema sp. GBBB05]|uniref:hypothetical protein n=1 Tax=Pantanalinema sp. GBBB05 TaxID=2604139 RepID=UPI001D4F6377|nr:hypothetical protein [Pantanalinema sp. GBBB05]
MKTRVLSILGAASAVASLALPASAQYTAVTEVLPKETLTTVTELALPTPPVQPYFYTLPNVIVLDKDTSVTTNTPITDKYAPTLPNIDYSAWAEQVRSCLYGKPVLRRVVGDQAVPFVVNGAEGVIKLNANDRAVCPG